MSYQLCDFLRMGKGLNMVQKVRFLDVLGFK